MTMEPEKNSKPEDIDLPKLIGGAWMNLRRIGRKLFQELESDLTFDQGLVIFILQEEDGASIGEIAEKSDRDRTTTSRMISGLEKKGLVIRVIDQQDSRQKLIYLTRKAKEFWKNMDDKRVEFTEAINQGILYQDIKCTADTLAKIITNLGKM